jgi:hypothetical protein
VRTASPNRCTEWRPGYAPRRFGSRWRAAIGELIVSCICYLDYYLRGLRDGRYEAELVKLG